MAVEPQRGEPAPAGRSARKRAAILDAAAEVFLERGYVGTSMDDVAARAGVSKQTIYKHFADKEGLFTALVLHAVEGVEARIGTASPVPHDPEDLVPALRELAERLHAAIVDPGVLRLRRLVAGEALRFPELGRLYYEQGFQRGLSTLAVALEQLSERGLLAIDDPETAAAQFAGLVLWTPANRALFVGDAPDPDPEAPARRAAAAVDVFLAAYGTRAE